MAISFTVNSNNHINNYVMELEQLYYLAKGLSNYKDFKAEIDKIMIQIPSTVDVDYNYIFQIQSKIISKP